MASLMIVESPNKCKKLMSILGKDWSVVASVGHIQDLPSKGGGLHINKDTLEMNLELSERGRRVISDIKSKLSHFDRIVISTDPDREGEAIARDLRDRLNLGDRYERCTFNEITKTAVLDAVNNNMRKIDEDLVAAQESRRILDRVTGWELTTAVTNFLGRLSPVGRVQSQAVNLIVQREREYDAFTVTNHYGIKSTIGVENSWNATLNVKDSGLGQVVDGGKVCWTDKAAAESLRSKIATLTVVSSEEKEHDSFAPAPFETSTLQQASLNKLGFNSKKTDATAQALYQAGHITYIRTDSTEISDESFVALREYALGRGLPVLEEKRVGQKSAVAQEAHECIRPSDFNFLGDSGLTSDEKMLYKLIWTRTVASQLEPVKSMNTTAVLSAEIDGATYLFKATGSVPLTKGWKVLLDNDDAADEDAESDKKEEEAAAAKNPVPILTVGDVLTVSKSELLSQKTQKPTYFTQASLGKRLKAESIGRPATYTSIFEKIGETGHKYVFEDQSKSKTKPFLRPMQTAFDLIDTVSDVFKIMDVNFTREMEKGLDSIATGDMEYEGFVKGFFKVIDEEIERLSKKPGAAILEPCRKCDTGKLISMPPKVIGDNRWWKCNSEECEATVSDHNGKPITDEIRQQIHKEKIAPFLKADGTPKFPCPTEGCGCAMIRIASKKKKNVWFWGCSSPKNTPCSITAFDDAKNQSPVYDTDAFFAAAAEEEKKGFSNEDGTAKYPCPMCGNHVVKRISSKKSKEYWACVTPSKECDFFTWPDTDGTPIMNAEERKAEKAAEREALLKSLSNEDGTPKWACGSCGGHLNKKPTSKDPNKNWFGCTNFPKCSQSYFEDADGNPNYASAKGKSGGKGGKSGAAKKPSTKKPAAGKKRTGVARIHAVVGKR